MSLVPHARHFVSLLPILLSVVVLNSCSHMIHKPAASGRADLQARQFGTMPDGTPVQIFTMQNRNGLIAKVTEYGAILTELWVPDRKGNLTNIVLGFDTLEQYLRGHPFFGATTGRKPAARMISMGTDGHAVTTTE